MKRAFLIITAVVLTTLGGTGCRSGGPVETQRAFGARMAKQNLWREAMFRFRRAVELDPTDAEARSNLAVALEANGDFEGAAREYREAMRLDKSNQYIQKNYSRFVEFTSRNKKREMREPRHQEATPPKEGAATGTAAAPPAGTAPTPPPGETPAQPAAQPAPPAGQKPDAQPAKPPAEPAPDPKPAAAAPADAPARPATPPPPPPGGAAPGGLR